MERGLDIEDLQDVAQLRVIVTMRDGHDSNLYGTGSQLCYHIMVRQEPPQMLHWPVAITQHIKDPLAQPLGHELSAITSWQACSQVRNCSTEKMLLA